MNKTIIKLFAVLGVIGALLGLLFSFLPISNLAIFPAVFGLIFGFIAYYFAKKQQQSFSFARIVVLLALLAILISVGKQLFTNTEVNDDAVEEMQLKEVESEEDAIKDIEELDNELDELDDIEELE